MRNTIAFEIYAIRYDMPKYNNSLAYSIIHNTKPLTPNHNVTAIVGISPESWGVSFIFHFDALEVVEVVELPLFCLPAAILL